MSYQKTTDAGTVKIVQFYYGTVALFNELKQRTAFRSRSLKDNEGNSLFDEFAMTSNEEALFMKILDYAVHEIYGEVVRLADGTVESVFIDDDSKAGIPLASSGFSLLDYEAYNTNVLKVIDKKIQECIVLYIAQEWWGITALKEEANEDRAQYTKGIFKLKKSVWELLKPLMT